MKTGMMMMCRLSGRRRAPTSSSILSRSVLVLGLFSKEIAKLGRTVCTPIELSDSKFFDVTDLRLIEWIFHTLKSGRFLSIMVKPVCASFSPAAYRAVRRYSQPEGFDRREPKKLLGNVIAYRCLVLLWYAAVQ